jgi:hypothetical protein
MLRHLLLVAISNAVEVLARYSQPNERNRILAPLSFSSAFVINLQGVLGLKVLQHPYVEVSIKELLSPLESCLERGL